MGPAREWPAIAEISLAGAEPDEAAARLGRCLDGHPCGAPRGSEEEALAWSIEAGSLILCPERSRPQIARTAEREQKGGRVGRGYSGRRTGVHFRCEAPVAWYRSALGESRLGLSRRLCGGVIDLLVLWGGEVMAATCWSPENCDLNRLFRRQRWE